MLSTTQGGSPPVSTREIMISRFRQARKFIAPLSKIIAMGLATNKKNKTPLGRAMSQILQSCMEGEYPAIRVNPAKVLLSRGALYQLEEVETHREGDQVKIQWAMPSHEIFEHYYADDQVLLCAYNPELGLACINEHKVLRTEKKLEMTLADGLKGQKVHLYLMVHTWDKKKFADSLYLGEYL